jgi:hypothetical protein
VNVENNGKCDVVQAPQSSRGPLIENGLLFEMWCEAVIIHCDLMIAKAERMTRLKDNDWCGTRTTSQQMCVPSDSIKIET